jgi:hypothetical protein
MQHTAHHKRHNLLPHVQVGSGHNDSYLAATQNDRCRNLSFKLGLASEMSYKKVPGQCADT